MDGFTQIARPLITPTKEDFPFIWGEEQHTAFEKVTGVLVTRISLALCDPKLERCSLLREQARWNYVYSIYVCLQTTKEEERNHTHE